MSYSNTHISPLYMKILTLDSLRCYIIIISIILIYYSRGKYPNTDTLTINGLNFL